jgi:hypothetical protein
LLLQPHRVDSLPPCFDFCPLQAAAAAQEAKVASDAAGKQFADAIAEWEASSDEDDSEGEREAEQQALLEMLRAKVGGVWVLLAFAFCELIKVGGDWCCFAVRMQLMCWSDGTGTGDRDSRGVASWLGGSQQKTA